MWSNLILLNLTKLENPLYDIWRSSFGHNFNVCELCHIHWFWFYMSSSNLKNFLKTFCRFTVVSLTIKHRNTLLKKKKIEMLFRFFYVEPLFREIFNTTLFQNIEQYDATFFLWIMFWGEIDSWNCSLIPVTRLVEFLGLYVFLTF